MAILQKLDKVLHGGLADDQRGFLRTLTRPAPSRAGDAVAIDALVSQLERDVSLTLRLIQDTSAQARSKVDESVALARKIQQSTRGLTALAASARRTADDLVSTSQTLVASNEDIGKAAAETDLFLSEARELSQSVGLRMDALGAVARTIAEVVDIIRTIGRQTNLIAINAAIEAARAGASGRGFSVVASQVKSLASEAQQATSDVAFKISELEKAVVGSSQKVMHMLDLLNRADPLLQAIRQASDQQIAGARSVGGRATATADFADAVAENADAVRVLAETAARSTTLAGAAAGRTEATLDRLGNRSMFYFRQAMLNGQRAFQRMPVLMHGSVACSTTSHDITIIELAEDGVTIAIPKIPFDYDDIRQVAISDRYIALASVDHISDIDCRLAFKNTSRDIVSYIQHIKREQKKLDGPIAEKLERIAMEIQSALSEGILSGEVRFADLITDQYALIEDTAPPQYLTPASAFYKEKLQWIIDQRKNLVEGALFTLAVDRNCYVPVHYSEYSNAQRRDDLEWNDLNCRDRRIMVRAQVLRAARNEDRGHVTLFVRDMNDGSKSYCRLYCAPIWVQGTLWGNLTCAVPMSAMTGNLS